MFLLRKPAYAAYLLDVVYKKYLMIAKSSKCSSGVRGRGSSATKAGFST